MKTPTFKIYLLGLLPALVIIFSGLYAYSDRGGVTQIIKNATAPFNDEKSVDSDLTILGKTVLVKIRYQGGAFWTETRKDKVERYQCSQCHKHKTVTAARASEMAHGDITLVHGGQQKPLSCFTCHNEEEPDFLVTEAGVSIDMDHSYQMCAQCHFRQSKDWVGGAHGKRISYWAGKRVVQNCTSCHDPHSPRFEKRWPKTYSPPFEK
jgi:hypothetical protein